jgi:hypothetical protein
VHFHLHVLPYALSSCSTIRLRRSNQSGTICIFKSPKDKRWNEQIYFLYFQNSYIICKYRNKLENRSNVGVLPFLFTKFIQKFIEKSKKFANSVTLLVPCHKFSKWLQYHIFSLFSNCEKIKNLWSLENIEINVPNAKNFPFLHWFKDFWCLHFLYIKIGSTIIETFAESLPCNGAGTQMCQLCKFSPNRENTECQCYRITLHEQSPGTWLYPGKDQKVCQGFSLYSSHFQWQKPTYKLRFKFYGKNIFPRLLFNKIHFGHHQKCFIFIKAWFYLPWTHSWALQIRSLEKT